MAELDGSSENDYSIDEAVTSSNEKSLNSEEDPCFLVKQKTLSFDRGLISQNSP